MLELQNGLGWHEQSLEKIYREKEKEITSVLQSAPKSDIILAQLKNVGLDLDAFVKQYGKEKILNAVWYAKDLKDRDVYKRQQFYIHMICIFSNRNDFTAVLCLFPFPAEIFVNGVFKRRANTGHNFVFKHV